MKSDQILGALESAEAVVDQAQGPDKEARRKAFLEKKQKLEALYTSSLEKIRQGDSDLFKAFLDIAARFPATEYFKNLVLLAAQRPDATLVKPGYVWAKKGIKVPPKSKAIGLFEQGAMWTDEEKQRTGFFYDPKECYDVSDLEGIRIVNAAKQEEDHGRVIAAMYTVLSDPAKYEETKNGHERLPVTFAISETQTESARYDPVASVISVRKDLPPKDCCESVIMELCHRERFLGGWEGDRRTHEDMFIAYAATYVICRNLNLPADDFDFPVAFLEAKDNDTFEKELRAIVKTANVIGERLSAELFAMRKEEERNIKKKAPAASEEPVQQGV